MKQNRKKRAFTLVEIVVVIAIIGILSAVLIPTFSGAIASARKGVVEAATDSYRKGYLSLTATKGTGCKYYKEVEVEGGDQMKQPIYHAPFGPAELADFAEGKEAKGLRLVTNWAMGDLDCEVPGEVCFDLVGFVYVDIDRGYYGYFNAKENKFEVLSVSELPSPGGSSYTQIIDQYFGKGMGILPKYWYPGVERVHLSDILDHND